MARNVTSLLQKILDKILAMTAISIALCPGYRVDDQVRDLVEAKLGKKISDELLSLFTLWDTE
jgi:hypothetical protein